MLRVGPGALELRLEVRAARHEQHGVGREQARDRESLDGDRIIPDLAVDRQNERQIDGPRRPLRVDVEVAQINDFIAPQLGADGLRHAERVDVENAAANAELGDVLDHWYALEADRLQMPSEGFQAVTTAFAQLDP